MRIVKSDHMFSNTNRKIHRRKQLAPKVIQIYTQSNSTKKSFHVPLSSPQKSELSVSRDKGQRSRFQNKILCDVNLHSNQRTQDHAHGTIKTHSGN